MARNQRIHEHITCGLPLEVDERGGRRTRTVHFFDFDHPAPRDRRNEYVVTTQLRVLRGSERDGRAEDEEKLAIQGANTLDRLFDAMFREEPEELKAIIRRRFANKETVAEADRRIEMIALDIAEHFRAHVQPNGFKAQVVAPSRQAAVKYAEKLNGFGLSAYPIITTGNDDGPEFRPARELNQEQIIAAFKDPAGEPRVLVVVDMPLTGFDAPVEQVLYLDRSLREHGLLQAIARVHRPCTVVRKGAATEKRYGLVVDYWGVSQELEAALAVFEQEDTREAWTPQPEDPAPLLESAARQAEVARLMPDYPARRSLLKELGPQLTIRA